MPYINFGNRMAVDVIIEGLVKRLREIECCKGDLNYTVTRIVLESMKPGTGWDYHSLSDAVGALKDAAVEIERRLLGPYEDTGVRKNGDLKCFNETFAYIPEIHAIVNANDPNGIHRQIAAKIQEGLSKRHEERLARGDEGPWRAKLAADLDALKAELLLEEGGYDVEPGPNGGRG